MSFETRANELVKLEKDQVSIIDEEYAAEKELHEIRTQIAELSFKRKAAEAKLSEIQHRRKLNAVNRSLKTKEMWAEK
jgi:chromosome segregation ATPase